jgi:branched-chain amino acid aminotransferase
MSMGFMIDGQIVPPERAVVSVLDRGLLYGDSVFETIRTYGGRPFALDEHVDRLAQSASRVLIELPASPPQIADEVRRAVESTGNAESYARITVTRGTGETLGLDPGLAVHPLRIVIVGPLQPPPAAAYDQGISVVTYRTQRTAEATEASGAKVGNYLVAVLAMQQAKQAGAAEALIVDGAGHVVEGATSNVFAVLGGRLVTPPESAGILAGITRRYLLQVAAELELPVVYEPLTVERLLGADEVFISSSIREVLPVVRIDQQPVAAGTPGRWTPALLQRFREKAYKSIGLRWPGNGPGAPPV